jgi:hypothetical protein
MTPRFQGFSVHQGAVMHFRKATSLLPDGQIADPWHIRKIMGCTAT